LAGESRCASQRRPRARSRGIRAVRRDASAPGASGRGRRQLRFVLFRVRCVMTSEISTTSWAMLLALGAFHGINPGMGWLFAVALGMQERRRGAVLRALLPLCAGHALAVAVAVGAALAIGFVIPLGWLRWPIAGVLVALGALRFFRHRHPRWGSMRVSMGGLTVWSFLMATAHGAGLMVVPVFMGMSMPGMGEHAHHMHVAG